jgi:acyl-CoA reductase-like NAD-dependent aldehyde dehydrogenase
MSTTIVSTTGLADAIRRCRAEQAAWAQLPVAKRLLPVKALRRLLAAECDALCDAVGRDLGKTPEETLAGDVLPLADACAWLQHAAAGVLRPRRVPVGRRPLWLWGQADTVLRRPHGVVGLIGTWNYPLFLSGVVLVHALTAGNGVVWKPSEVAPASALALFELVRRAGFPAGLVQLLEATREGGRELAEADIDHVAFTGSSAVGRALATTLAPRLITSTLELSGCDAMFVLDDADVKLAARAAWFGANLNRGQTCLAVRRAFVHRSLYPAFIEVLRPLAEAVPPVRLALRAQVEQADRLVREALAEGGRLLVPPAAGAGENGEPLCRPRVVLDARPEMALCREPSFAPLLAVLPFDTPEEALRMDAQCPYGLGASVFTRRHGRGEALAAQLRTGMVAINDVVVPTVHPATPFGGRRASGWGVTQGAEGLLEMTVPQVISVRTDAYRPHYDMAPGVAVQRGDLIRAFLDLGHGTTLGQRARGVIGLMHALWRETWAGDASGPRKR